MFTFTSSGSEDFNIELISLILFIRGSEVYPVDYVALYFTSSNFSISLYVNSFLKNITLGFVIF